MAEKIPPESFVCRLRSGRLEEWDLYRCHEPAGRCRLRLRRVPDDAAPGDRLRCLDIQTVSARDRRHHMRGEVLRGEALPPSRTGNHDVIEQVAAMVARRELCVVVAIPAVRPAFVEKAPSAPARRAPTPSQLRPPEEVPIDLDVPSVPAAVLLEAARAGTPFCEH